MMEIVTQPLALDPSSLVDGSILDLALGCIIQTQTVASLTLQRLCCFLPFLEPGYWQGLLHQFQIVGPHPCYQCIAMLGIIVNNEVILKKINRILRHIGLTRSELGRQIGVEQSYLQKMLTGGRTLRLDVLAKIADVFNMPLWQLMRTDDHQPVALGQNQVPLVDPQALLYLQEEPLAMEHVKKIINVPRLGGEDTRPGLVAVEVENNKPAIYILDPHDRTPCEDEQFLCRHKLKKRFVVRPLKRASGQWLFIDKDDEPCLEFDILGRALYRIENLMEN